MKSTVASICWMVCQSASGNCSLGSLITKLPFRNTCSSNQITWQVEAESQLNWRIVCGTAVTDVRCACSGALDDLEHVPDCGRWIEESPNV